MKFIRSALSVLSAPVLFGFICVPLVGLLYGRFPELLNEQGGTAHVPLLVATELLQLLVLILCGYVVALLAPGHIRHHVVLATVLMMVIGVSVQLGFWEAVPPWHHFIFFGCIVGGMYLGAVIRARQVSGGLPPTAP
jgi:hypothetical protein